MDEWVTHQNATIAWWERSSVPATMLFVSEQLAIDRTGA